ncbi:aromatic amino acid hydroxylase [Tumebacillus sp. ITR2]|uniref:Aromatic amino acid hydroxylase n=1 Tax=Tumebacillus amylolyticus TaxID=2801339 RepID=A0ABS1J934_9BACL|nr:aromatic amino acid hydroxylase [Tumebacillus amylolyticus]MBL0386791.1 aromatic amino acid hydroxylase [Tumebacillus amylolyticus]
MTTSTVPSTKRIPAHLRPFVVEQDYPRYTPVDQAVWRYVLRQNSAFLSEKGFGSYRDGLAFTGMSVERIPRVEEMNEVLAPHGWGAVAIDGFIPSVTFFDFQAHGLLPISSDIRMFQNIAYTPAPDIIHESAGHAPMLIHPGYGEFLKLFGGIGAKALSSKQDVAVYEAMRLVSILKEDPSATQEDILQAEQNLDAALAAKTEISEETLISRIYWWTVEYGLIGEVDDPKLYGAGLLSSMGESRSCLLPPVERIPFTLEGVLATDFDITRPQPQLFVCRDFDELTQAVERFADTMAFRVGGTSSLKKALDSGSPATAVYSSGLQVSGEFTALEFDEAGEAVYLKTTGPTALAFADQELPGHGIDYHSQGFGSPIGLLRGIETPLEEFTDAQLREHGIVTGHQTLLEFASGVHVQGVVKYVHREGGQLVLIGFEACTVTLADTVLFEAAWGTFDMAVGQAITSVYAGVADPERFHAHAYKPSETRTVRPNYIDVEKLVHSLYRSIRDLRESKPSRDRLEEGVQFVLDQIEEHGVRDWLLHVEILELLTAHRVLSEGQSQVREILEQIAAEKPELRSLIQNGLKLI